MAFLQQMKVNNLRFSVLTSLDLASVCALRTTCSALRRETLAAALHRRPIKVYILGRTQFCMGIHHSSEHFEVYRTECKTGYIISHGGMCRIYGLFSEGKLARN